MEEAVHLLNPETFQGTYILSCGGLKLMDAFHKDLVLGTGTSISRRLGFQVKPRWEAAEEERPQVIYRHGLFLLAVAIKGPLQTCFCECTWVLKVPEHSPVFLRELLDQGESLGSVQQQLAAGYMPAYVAGSTAAKPVPPSMEFQYLQIGN